MTSAERIKKTHLVDLWDFYIEKGLNLEKE